MNHTRHFSMKFVLSCGVALGFGAPLSVAQAGTETLLYSFTGSTGQNPQASLYSDQAGNLYGTTESGGAQSYGAVFKLATNGTESVVFSFHYSDGARSYAGLVADKAGNLYGTTQQGGAKSYGVVFKLAPDGTETMLHTFTGQTGSDGAYPVAPLVMDKKGNLFGTTQHGGPNDDGTVFRVAKDGTTTVIHAFAGSDGDMSYGGLLEDKKGNLYGTTIEGGANNDGVVFKIAKNGTETVLHSFAGTDGQYPVAGLVMDKTGNLFGTTKQGGAHGTGTVFKVTPAGTETVLYSFGGGTDGAFPMCGLTMDKKGNFYATTNGGGAHGAGTVFKLSPKGAETILYSFAGGSDGAFPFGGVIMDQPGNLYGTTSSGGASNDGTVFKITP